jgi:hypothetical protein
MYECLTSLVLLVFICSLITAYTCPQISEFYVECSNLYTLNQSIDLCSKNQMVLLNLTNSTTATETLVFLNQTLQSLNCTSDFWYAYADQTGLIGSTNTSAGGVVCTLTALLGLYCVPSPTSSPIIQAATVCARINEKKIQQKCLDNEVDQRFDIQKYTFIRKTIYAEILNTFESRSQTQCNSICSKISICIGANYNQYNCTLYM